MVVTVAGIIVRFVPLASVFAEMPPTSTFVIIALLLSLLSYFVLFTLTKMLFNAQQFLRPLLPRLKLVTFLGIVNDTKFEPPCLSNVLGCFKKNWFL